MFRLASRNLAGKELIMNVLFLIDVQIGLPNTRFTVTESVDSTIMLCAELQVGSLEREVSVAIVTEGSNGRQLVSNEG